MTRVVAVLLQAAVAAGGASTKKIYSIAYYLEDMLV